MYVNSIGLEETRDELQAAAALHAGRELLQWNLCSNNVEKGPTSLAVELLAGINHDEVSLFCLIFFFE